MALLPTAGIGGGAPGGGMLAALQGRMQNIQGAGMQADAMLKIKNAIALLETALPNLATGSPEHSSVAKSIQDLSKHVPTGESSAGVQMTQLRDLLSQVQRSALLARMAAAQGGGAGGPGAAPPMAGPAPPVPGV